MAIRVHNHQFIDEHGRVLILRGVNLGGSSKVPAVPEGASHLPDSFIDPATVSFVGRPFPLAEADEHFGRLRRWGLTFLRFLVTWEAIEHAGPGRYDEEYLDYIHAILSKAHQHGIQVFIDPHQDVWSRFSGGDGAPAWTFELLGMRPERFAATGAALLHHMEGDAYEPMIWPSNANRYAAATLSTLFFAGNLFAPATLIEGEPVQEFLQRHYIAAVCRLARRLADLPNIVGYDTVNECIPGYVGHADINKMLTPLLQRGPSPTVWQSMLLAAGYAQTIDIRTLGPLGNRRRGRALINPDGVSLWRDGVTPIWQANGVWSDDGAAPRLLQPAYFARINGRPVDFHADCLRPFVNRYAAAIRAVQPQALIFVEGAFGEPMDWRPQDAPNVVNAVHWYDLVTLFTKEYRNWLGVHVARRRPVLGRKRVRRSFRRQIRELVEHGRRNMNGAPTLIGETGIPFDLDNGAAFATGDFRPQIRAMDATLRAMERNLVSYTLWNYTADNSNKHGDQWNGEDLSIFSRDQQDDPDDPYDGGRALEAVLRPYAMATAGAPQRMRFNRKSRRFTFTYLPDPAIVAPTEIFVPHFHYPTGITVTMSRGDFSVDWEAQRVRCFNPEGSADAIIVEIEGN